MNNSFLKIVALGLAVCCSAFAQVVVSPYFGFDQANSAKNSLTNAVDAFQTGAVSSNNILLNGVNNVFTLTFTSGANVGTAKFRVTDNYGANLVGGNQVLRQFNNSLEGPGTSAGQLTITLLEINNLDSIYLSRVQVTGGGVSQYTALLPSGSSSTAYNTSITATTGAWSTGESLVISNLSSTAAVINVVGLGITATPSVAAVPEPSAAAALVGVSALGLVAFRRRRVR